MLTFYASKTNGPVTVAADAQTLPPNTAWVDAFDPTPEDRARLARLIGTRIPTLDDLVEIESSSRLSVEGDALFISIPAVVKDETGYPTSTPVGFVVTADCVATVRFAHLPSFEHLARRICDKGDLSEGGLGATVTLVEIIVDHIADLLEHVGTDLDKMSRSIFAGNLLAAKGRRPHQANRILAGLLGEVGRKGDLASKVSETLLGLSRMAPFLSMKSGKSLTPELKTRLDTIGADTKSLHEYQEHLSNKTQFLLDTLLGLGNIEQNNVFRVLTVVSVVGIPPTFVASMYGMNFKNMPELEWTHGYAYGLTVIAVSAIAPALWFKIKGWW